MVWGCLAVESAPCQMLINYWDCFGDMEYCSTSIKGRLGRSIAQWHVAMIRYNFCVYVRRDFMWMWLCREFTSADLLLFEHKHSFAMCLFWLSAYVCVGWDFMAPHLGCLFISTLKKPPKTPGLSGCICICQWSPSSANLSDPINNKNNILRVTQPKTLWDICHQLSRKCVSGSLDCYMFFISHGTERLAGFLIEIYIGVMVHSCFGACMCGMFGHSHIRVKYVFWYVYVKTVGKS